MLFSNIDFDFAHFHNFNFAHFEIEESFRPIWVKWSISRANFHSSIYKVLVSNMDFFFAHFVFKASSGQKLQNDPLDLKISILFLVSQIMMFILNINFVHFEY